MANTRHRSNVGPTLGRCLVFIRKVGTKLMSTNSVHKALVPSAILRIRILLYICIITFFSVVGVRILMLVDVVRFFSCT